MNKVIVSVVMPVYNEEKYIDKCIDSLLKQDYPLENMEWIFVDGMSSDHTKEILIKKQQEMPELIQVYDNPYKIVPYAMNIGIKKSSGKYIIRLDAHAEYAPDYFSKCVHYLETIDADNVGGVAETKAKSRQGQAIARMLSSKFGVGNSQFRTNGESGYVDTVPFGAFKREVFQKWGGYDERLVRNQDNEMNFRIRKNGGKVYLANDIHLSYYCRDSIKGIAQMGMKNGTWNVITLKLCPGAMGLRHFIPLIFVLSHLFLFPMSFVHPAFAWIWGLEWVLYLSLDLIFSVKAASGLKDFLLLIMLFPVFHIAYGSGSVKGIFKLMTKEFRDNGYAPNKI